MNNYAVIDNLNIKQDSEGRFCLNDLQKVATAGMKSRTVELYEFMRRPETQALIAEIETTGNSRIKAHVSIQGRNGGTYVVKELVYAYAMWISPAFNLKVIRAFDRLQTQGVAVADHTAADLLSNPLKYLEAIIGQAKELQAQLDIAKPKVEIFDAHVADKGETVARFVRTLDGVNSIQ